MEIKHQVIKLHARTGDGKKARVSFLANMLVVWQELSDTDRAQNLGMHTAVTTQFSPRPMLVTETVDEIDAMVEGRETWEER